jgi:hypothetical protein
MQSSPDYKSFWPIYLAAHRRPATRAIHMAGTGAGFLLILAAILLRSPWLLLAAIVAGYAFAWISHGVVERNKPATFRHPLWSIFSDFRMLFLWLGGRLDAELSRHGIHPQGSAPN